MLKIITILCLILLVSCNDKLTEEDYKVEITQVETNKEILLTSYTDYKYMLLLIPIEFELRNKGENQILDYRFKIDNCDAIDPPYITYFETDSIPLGFHYDKMNKINEYTLKRITIYSTYKIFPDSLPSHKKFLKEYEFIKRNNNEATDFKNDTIKYAGLNMLKDNHADYIKENIRNGCDEIIFYNTYFNKQENRLASENIIVSIKYE